MKEFAQFVAGLGMVLNALLAVGALSEGRGGQLLLAIIQFVICACVFRLMR